MGAALTGDAYVEIISDGMHIHPAVVKIAINAKGPEGVVLVTDSMHAAGHGQGEYDFGGYKIVIEGGVAKQEDGTLAGSIINLMDAEERYEFAGLSLEMLLPWPLVLPRCWPYDRIGSIEPGNGLIGGIG